MELQKRKTRSNKKKNNRAQKENSVPFYGKIMEYCIFSQKWFLLIISVNYREISAFTKHSSGTVGCMSAEQRWSAQIKMVKSNDCVTNAFLDQLLWSVKSHAQQQRMRSEIPGETMMPGHGNASPQGDLRGNALFLFSEGVSRAGQAFCGFDWVFKFI